jgi:peroxiredoxin
MKHLINITLLLIAVLIVDKAEGQTKSSVNDFTLVNTVDNQSVSLSSFSNKKGIAIIFTSDFCPYSKLYEARIGDLAQEFSNKDIQFILINPNNPLVSQEDAVEKMAKNAKEKGYRFPYLADKEQKVANIFGATKTPEVYLLQPSGTRFNIVYSGAIDDNPQVATDVDKHYLKDAITNLLEGKSIAPKYQRPTGCMIKKR